MGLIIEAETWETLMIYNIWSLSSNVFPNVEGPIGNDPECEIYFVPVDQTEQWGHELPTWSL